jgi:uncharacterized protein
VYGRKPKKKNQIIIKAFICLTLSICFFFYAGWIEPNWIDVNQVSLSLPHLDKEFNGYRIVQISDIHQDKWTTENRLHRVVNLIRQQQPDLVVITGDLVTADYQRFIPNLEKGLAKLTAKDRVIAILGNHDHWANPEGITKALERDGFIVLRNQVYTLSRGNKNLHIGGVDDVFLGKARLNKVLDELPSEGAAILLAHEPDFAVISSRTGRFDLQLSGHSHGGQVRLPILKPFALPPQGQEYYAGLYQVGEMLQYTNRGIGVNGLHLRFFSRPEITVFNLSAG